MSKKLQITLTTVLMLALFGFFTFAGALTEKELWEKEHADDYRLQPLDPPVILEHGGPDGGGYYYIDSDDNALNAPVVNWTDISGIGTPVTLGDDDNQGPFPIGFDFTFYGNTYTQFNICSNGWISFTSTSTRYSNISIPDDSEPNNLLAIFWDDINPSDGGQAYYYTDTNTNQLIVSYDGVPYYGTSGLSSLYFQAVLSGDDSSIVYHYGSMDDAGHGNNGATVGIENAGGTIGTEYIYNQAGIHDSMAVYFGFEGPIFGEHEVSPVAFIDLPELGQVGDPVTPEVTFLNQGNNTESFQTRVIVNLDGNEVYNQTAQVTNLESGSSVDVSFPVFTSGGEGIHQFVAISELTGDENPANDTIRANYNAIGTIYIEDFEATDGLFVGDGEWQWGVSSSGPGGAHSGVNLWATNLSGDYSNAQFMHLVSPPFGLSTNAILGIWHWYDTESSFDGGNVKISTDDGVSWTVIVPDGGYDGIANSANPLDGEEIFTGHNNMFWQFETFDLSAYAGAAVMFKFDFGSDASVTDAGWYIDDFTVFGGGGVDPGYIAGTVTELASGNPIEGALVAAGNATDITDASGNYVLELIAGTYSVTASATNYNPETIGGIVVIEEDTTYQDFALMAPVIQVDTSPIVASVAIGDTMRFTRNVANIGNGDLDFTISISIGNLVLNVQPEIRPSEPASIIRDAKIYSSNTDYSPTYKPGNLPTILDVGDELFRFDPETPTGDIRILGIEFDGVHFWFTGANDQITKKLHKFDRDGNYIESFDQGTTSNWGWRDLAWDGQYLYGSDENELAIIDPATGQKIGELPMPTGINPPMRGLAYDPVSDHFWSANFSSSIIEFDRQGNTLASYSNVKSIYGLAWDNVSEDGPWLWVYSQDGTPATEISQFNPATGTYTGFSFYAIDSTGIDAIAGGICFTDQWVSSLGIVVCVIQDAPDMAAGYEITPASQWLTVDPMSWTLAPSENIDLDILVDFTGDGIVPDTTYNATISVINSTPDTPVIPVTIDTQTGIEDELSNLPREISLYQNYPNPFNPATEIKFALPEQMDVSIEVFNVLGQKTAVVAEGLFPAGNHSVTWDGSNAASGVYYYKLSAGDKVMVKKMTLLK